MELGKFAALACFLACVLFARAALAGRDDAIAMVGEPALPADADHMPYADPQAPQGGVIRQVFLGSYDGFNPFIVKGVAADGIRELVYESLMRRSQDEPFTLYGLLAQSIDVPDDRSRVTFRLRPEARFSDGAPVTVDDVVFSLETLRKEGRPNHRLYYGKVVKIERPAPNAVTFVFDAAQPDRELPLILGLMPVLPRHVFDNMPFAQSGNAVPVGSGPYKVTQADIGRRITFTRDPHYWGRALWLNRGFFNADEIRYDYMRDESSAFSAFKTGLVDIWLERDSTRWAGGYDIPALREGRVRREELANGRASGMYGFAFNTRRAPLNDVRVRRALTLLFDFDWVNRTLLQGAFRPIESHFSNTPMASLPAQETALTERARKREALSLLGAAGYALQNGELVKGTTGRPLLLQLMVSARDDERMALAYGAMLKEAGVTLQIQNVDSAQFQRRLQTFDFDLAPFRWSGTLSPGNEQFFRWGARAADEDGSYNIAGVKDPAIDNAITVLTKARTREDMEEAARALDKLLMAGAYVMPLYYRPNDWVASSTRLGHPGRQPLWGYDAVLSPATWWVKR